jgi:ketosteroid isomerase-like protein
MRYRLCAWLLAIAVPGSFTAAAELAASDDSSGALIALEQKWVAALERSDVKALSAMWARTYVDTDETGHRSDKVEVFRVLKSGALKLRKLQLSDMKVYVYGDAAIVTGASVQDGDFQGQPLARKIVFTDTFVRRGDEWMAVASQRTASQ